MEADISRFKPLNALAAEASKEKYRRMERENK